MVSPAGLTMFFNKIGASRNKGLPSPYGKAKGMADVSQPGIAKTSTAGQPDLPLR
jgi:hypothetical protein